MNPGPVAIASTTVKIVSAVPMPSMRGTVIGWFRPITVGRVLEVAQPDGTVKPSVTALQTSGVLIPKGEELTRQAGGGRSWQNWDLFCFPNLVLNTNDTVVMAGQYFTVMGKLDFSGNGYVKYSLVQSPQPNGLIA